MEWIVEEYGNIRNVDFQKLKALLKQYYGEDFTYEIIDKTSCASIKTRMDILPFIGQAIGSDMPPIVLMEFPSCWYLPGYSTHCDSYAITVLGVSHNHVLIWDTNPKVIALPVVVSIDWIKSHLSPTCQTLWIVPNNKLAEFERLTRLCNVPHLHP